MRLRLCYISTLSSILILGLALIPKIQTLHADSFTITVLVVVSRTRTPVIYTGAYEIKLPVSMPMVLEVNGTSGY